MLKVLGLSGTMIVGSFLIYCTNSAITDSDGGVIDAAANENCCGAPSYEWSVLAEGSVVAAATTPQNDVSGYTSVNVLLEDIPAQCYLSLRWRAHASGIWSDSGLRMVERRTRTVPVQAPYMELVSRCSDGQATNYAVIGQRQVSQ